MSEDFQLKKALVIDDDEKSVKLMKLLIEDIISVETAFNGKAGLEKIKQSYFDIIISDVHMPLMNGIELFYEAEATDSEIKKRFIFCTSSCDSAHLSFFKNNDIRHIQKPASFDEIRDIVSNILESNC